ncbi:efflux transporter outer membrane subunit [Labrys neptuniae]|uniref:Efflux transporter outer membrane subunit n=1 Tax=Labrys neptuniae TaxID=376174 RepID=A0ABV3PWD0_9HYPH
MVSLSPCRPGRHRCVARAIACNWRQQGCTIVRAALMMTVLAVVLSGCSTTAPTVAQAPVLPSSYGPGAARDVPRNAEAWWRQFHDPVLERLVAEARRQNLSIAEAQARLRAAYAQASTASALFLPTVDGSGQAVAANSRKTIDDTLHRPVMAGLDMSWDVGLFGLAEHSARAANADASIAQENLEAVRIVVTADVAAAYIGLRSAQHQTELTTTRVISLQRRVRLSRVRTQTGLALPGEEADGVAALEETRSELARLQSRVVEHQQQIATLLGTSAPDPTLLRNGPQPNAKDVPAVGHPADLLRARPDVRAAEQRVLRASAEVGIAQAELYPRLRLGGTIGIGGPTNGSLMRLAGGPSLQIPLFDYGRRKALFHARRALLDEALAAYRQTVLVAYQQASTAFAAWRAARASEARQASAIQALRRRDHQMRVLKREGLADARQFSEADSGWLDGQQRLVLARENEALALVALYKALGAATLQGEARGRR